ncbi:UDP-N-acetylmuramoyl-tripeptide--D-alanyl-D-alanine ligase [Psychromonas hadalis]|uniref:UDP-N-acetylmuramoyl-tripeptide--D-alanyl-D- alanine ligase n=1 Tax=Psychromonas hadalis TaxID=211669 RepID=UPI0003B77DC6|nr:UDP-N-acetylmuramoyl-tripeptide--D-alanyl-D-alanine ligase [Psychromonas hadalis]
MIPLTLAEIALAIDGKLLNSNALENTIDRVCTDTRHIQQGCLFLALQGERFDAHQFIEEARQSGAKALIVHQQHRSILPSILVKDTRIALGLLAAYVKSKIAHLKCVAITGSNGKTTTKEMLSAILNCFSRAENSVLSTAGNFNNDIGVPLTLLRLTEQSRFAVLELGANHQGEIAYTANLVKANVALINNVMPAHLEGFGSIEGVAKTKGEIWSSLTTEGTGIVNLDAKFADDYIQQLHKQQSHLFTFSQSEVTANLFASNIQYDELGRATFSLNYLQQTESVSLNLAGKHNVSNALAASAMAIVLGCELSIISQGLKILKEVAGRVNSCQVSDKITVIDDTYNANSASLKAAIDLLTHCRGEKTLIFADMGELGKYAEDEHRGVGLYAAEKGIDNLFTVGQLTKFTQQTFMGKIEKKTDKQTMMHFNEKEGLKAHLKVYLQQNKKMTLLVKGSRGTKMEEIVAYIKQPIQ